MIELVQIGKSYDGKTFVVDDVNVRIEKGEFFVLVGPSGCGKSTLLRMIAGLEPITSGSLRINGKEMNDVPPSERNLSMVFQNYALYPHLTVEENITFGLHTKKISKQERKKRCMEAAEMLGLTDYLKHKPRQLSGGQRQRVALARAIVAQTPICLMDEPLSNLDAKLRAKMRFEIRQLQQQLGITMIYVTHDQIEAMTMADRIMVMNGGRVQQIGEPLDVYNHPANIFVASFIGSPAMNMTKVDVLEQSLIFNRERIMRLAHRFPLETKNITIGVRPEHIRFANKNDPYFTVKVVNVERLGTETLITFALTKKEHWIARWNGQCSVRVGDEVPVTIDEQHVLFFNEAGERLYVGVGDDYVSFRETKF